MQKDRAAYRNVRFHVASTASIGGFYHNGSIMEENLIWILNDVLLLINEGHSWTIYSAQSRRPHHHSVKQTRCVWRLSSFLHRHSVSGQEDQFLGGVRARDGKCVISGQVNPGAQAKNGYKIVEFGPGSWGVDRRILNPICRDQALMIMSQMSSSDGTSNNPRLPICVVQESLFLNLTFPLGSDMMATLRDEPYGREMFEMEVRTYSQD
ncbi:hypothetical protein ACJ73_04380 [Blastomyces percursus]|uniref:Uncharacterized protein n=1 Tax=Blastomyces percursus TaxID=1658174 RepID=A0A1J9R6Y3_9EURO|nr:hypothetical protein ACJ73_04380 [Blastomyces percursus]